MADRLALFGLVTSQVGQAQLAGVAWVALHLAHNRLGDLAFIQGDGAAGGDFFQHIGQRLIAKGGTRLDRLATGLVEVGGGHRIFFQVLLGLEQGAKARADLEAAFGQRDGRHKQLCPGQLAVLLVRQLQHAHRAGHAD